MLKIALIALGLSVLSGAAYAICAFC